jgi:hypothetical protein
MIYICNAEAVNQKVKGARKNPSTTPNLPRRRPANLGGSIQNSIDIGRVEIAPPPFFAPFGRLNDGVLRGRKVGARMLVLRRIAAADMAALKAHAQMYPRVAGLEAALAAFRGRFDGFDVIFHVCTALCGHG